jgi:hypothetical protein
VLVDEGPARAHELQIEIALARFGAHGDGGGATAY